MIPMGYWLAKFIIFFRYEQQRGAHAAGERLQAPEACQLHSGNVRHHDGLLEEGSRGATDLRIPELGHGRLCRGDSVRLSRDQQLIGWPTEVKVFCLLLLSV